ncbi:MAG: polymer-forming cytoskeletal protein [Kiritimatiellia bacterium]|nr:polymer-forming cytoskeletal protein [Kiritimatiellia bacterium]
MPRSDKPPMIDGLTSVRAVRRTGKNIAEPRTRSSANKLPGAGKKKAGAGDSPVKPAKRIGKTAVPVRHDITCYECGYGFPIHGRLHKVICPKCHEALIVDDHCIEDRCTYDITTIGAIEVGPKAVVSDCRLIAGAVKVAGNIKDVTAITCENLTLLEGAKCNIAKVTTKNLSVGKNGKFTFTKRITCKNLDIEGNLKAKIDVNGEATIRPGGILRGEFRGEKLTIEDGGALSAKLVLGAGTSRR